MNPSPRDGGSGLVWAMTWLTARLEPSLQRFLRWRWPVALLASAAISCLAAVVQWAYARAGLDLEATLLSRWRGEAVSLPLSQVIVAALFAGSLGVGVMALAGHGVLRVVGGATRPLGATVRVSAFSSLGTMGKLVPVFGYFCALAAVLVLSLWGLRRVHGISWARAAVVVGVTTAALVLLAALAASWQPPPA